MVPGYLAGFDIQRDHMQIRRVQKYVIAVDCDVALYQIEELPAFGFGSCREYCHSRSPVTASKAWT